MLKAIHRMQRDERGFTLVELLIVIAIIAILAAIAIPQFSQYRANANKKSAIGNARTCLTIIAGVLANDPSATDTAVGVCPSGCTGNSLTATCKGSDGTTSATCTVGTDGAVSCT